MLMEKEFQIHYDSLQLSGETKVKKRLVTSALPYVNNIPHLGNLTQVLSADVFARFSRSMGIETFYVCGTDEYGTASETRALQEGVSPRELCDHYHKIHAEIYKWFNISFDYFGRTSTPKHTEIVQSIFHDVDANGYIRQEEIEQLYCPHCKRFLADRFVLGTCPHCGSEKARGDQCDSCQTLLDPTELVDPHCSVCGTTPVLKKTRHLYIDLPKALDMLKAWIDRASVEGFWAKNAVQVTNSWIRDGLKERCITRDLKWGIPVPKEGFEDKVFYVWFDAPIGYISMTAEALPDWQRWWQSPEDTELFQFIGKDNIPFHTVIFPASLLATGKKWTMLHHMSSTEYLNYEGGKFSKSEGVGIFGNDVQETGIPADVWRFYMFYNRPEKSDVNFSWSDFQEKVNGELIGNLSNLVNRTLTFISRFYDGVIPSAQYDQTLFETMKAKESLITDLLNHAEERDALRAIFSLCDEGNKAFQDGEPWKARKEDPARAASLLKTLCLMIKDVAVMIEPYMPSTSQKIFSFFTEGKKWDWQTLACDEGLEKVGNISLLFTKLDNDLIDTIRQRYRGTQAQRQEKEAHEEKKEMNNAEIENESIAHQFERRVTLKVAKITEVEKHPNGDLLYILHLDDGTPEGRTIVSSIVPYYKAEELQGRNIVVVANLKPANFRGVKSWGMLLAASDPDAEPHSTCEVLFADDIPAGTVLKVADQGEVEKVTTYIKPDHFFAMPLYTKDGVLMVDGKTIGAEGRTVCARKYINGPVG